MKKLLFLAIFISKIAIGQDSCNCDRPSWSLSTNLRSITGEVSHIAQKTRVGFSLGATLYTLRVPGGDKINGYMRVPTGSMSFYGTYKLLHKDSIYSLHLLAGGVFDLEKGIYPSGGIEVRKPITFNKKDYIRDKMLFIRGLYPFDFRFGIIFSF